MSTPSLSLDPDTQKEPRRFNHISPSKVLQKPSDPPRPVRTRTSPRSCLSSHRAIRSIPRGLWSRFLGTREVLAPRRAEWPSLADPTAGDDGKKQLLERRERRERREQLRREGVLCSTGLDGKDIIYNS